MTTITGTRFAAVSVKPLNVNTKAMTFIPDFKPYLIAAAVIAGLLMANMVTVYVWRLVTCGC